MGMEELFLGMLSKNADKQKAVQEKRRALMPQFETEEDALDYARRVALIRPGDTVRVLNVDDTGLHRAVFVCTDSDGDPSLLVYNPDNKLLMNQRTCWHAIVLD